MLVNKKCKMYTRKKKSNNNDVIIKIIRFIQGIKVSIHAILHLLLTNILAKM